MAAFVGVAVLIPLAALVVVGRRNRRLRQALGLPAGLRILRVRDAMAMGALFTLLASAASQPVISTVRSIDVRGDVEAYVLFDVSRSMLASESLGAPTRFDRAVQFALELRPQFDDVPVGVASLTDRPLPHVFPTADGSTFASVVTSAIGIEKPPPLEQGQARATTFQALESLAQENFFAATSTKRAVVVLTDGETRPFDPGPLAEELAAEAIELYFVRFWGDEERVWLAAGSPEPYRPDPASEQFLASLATDPRVSTFEESDVRGVAAAVKGFFGKGPLVGALADRQATPLAPWLALAGAIPLAFILVRRPR